MIHPSRLNSTSLGWHFLFSYFLKTFIFLFKFLFLLPHFKQNPRQFQTVRFSFDYFKQGVGTAQRCSVCHVYLYVRKHNMLNHLMSKVTGTEVNICSFIVSRLRTAAKTTFQLWCYSLLSCCVFACISFPSLWAKQVWLKTKTQIFWQQLMFQWGLNQVTLSHLLGMLGDFPWSTSSPLPSFNSPCVYATLQYVITFLSFLPLFHSLRFILFSYVLSFVCVCCLRPRNRNSRWLPLPLPV